MQPRTPRASGSHREPYGTSRTPAERQERQERAIAKWAFVLQFSDDLPVWVLIEPRSVFLLSGQIAQVPLVLTMCGAQIAQILSGSACAVLK